MGPEVGIRRVYDPPSAGDGRRILVDRMWPRGLKKEEAHLSEWLKELAPSAGLRKWFAHDASKWEEFRRRYAAELEEKREDLEQLRRECRKEKATLLFAARDEERNNAVVLKEVLEQGD
ncbi:MAG TPA: DUF488 family protein [Verrucomicrobiae bacterium]|nr:DUF488 family protein [Verrucomicrobiae bacterium]